MLAYDGFLFFSLLERSSAAPLRVGGTGVAGGKAFRGEPKCNSACARKRETASVVLREAPCSARGPSLRNTGGGTNGQAFRQAEKRAGTPPKGEDAPALDHRPAETRRKSACDCEGVTDGSAARWRVMPSRSGSLANGGSSLAAAEVAAEGGTNASARRV